MRADPSALSTHSFSAASPLSIDAILLIGEGGRVVVVVVVLVWRAAVFLPDGGKKSRA